MRRRPLALSQRRRFPSIAVRQYLINGDVVVCAAGKRQDDLRRLWGHAFPGSPWQGLITAWWTDMGWQRDDPSSDFRGAGLVALQNLLFMAQAGCPCTTQCGPCPVCGGVQQRTSHCAW